MKEEVVTLGSGCFWCSEAVYESVKGVIKVVSGYSGGLTVNPSYKEVSTGTTGHAEVVQITFDPEVISFEEILFIFFKTHDPTTLNRQGADIGTQYRSVIFYHTDKQQEVADSLIRELENQQIFENKIVTQIQKFNTFYIAEEYHQNYYARNPYQGYCNAVIAPKLSKFKKDFSKSLK
ncbi:MAG: peptide-methionine (S)-S-oxide reductase MsrA [Bacteroidales bacterium]|nr:peptide-methionine (S)-S-oxide reductase MsrA [Bacteroidales bacterium]MCF8390787.1 peptide-methionine (S)-S-oxide reductase MsrA [Bacteroidales bacterium]